MGATSITIRSALPNFIQIAELLAFDFDDVNVALASNGGVATALSQYYPGAAPEGGPKEVNDGAIPAAYDYDHNPAVPGIYHSGGTGADEFVTVTFAAPVTLSRVTIHGRGEGPRSRDIYDITINGSGGRELFSGRLDASVTGSDTIAFTATTAPAPEPGAWALMIVGFGGAGAVLRHRRRGVAAA